MLDEILHSIFKSANPDSSDEDIQKQVAGLKQSGTEAVKSALSFIPGMNVAAQVPSETAQAIGNKVINSNTVQDAASGVTQAKAGDPISGLSQGLVSGAAKDLTSSDTAPHPTSGVTKSWDAPTPPAPLTEEAPIAAPTGPSLPKVGSKPEVNPELSEMLKTGSDEASRQAMLEAERKKHNLGLIPVAGAGIGDAISHAATAFGAQATGSTQEKALERLDQRTATDKAQFEEKLKNDPNSEVSKHYQKVLGLMLGKEANGMDLSKMSASNIGATLPQVEKFMQKQMQTEAIKANRDIAQQNKSIALSEKEDQFNQRRWERFATAVNPLNAGSRKALGVAALNNMRADRLLATAQNDKITSQDYSNLVADLQGIYKGGVPDQVMLQHGDYPSIQRTAGQILGKITGNPQAINTPELKQHLMMLTRELKTIDNKAIDDNMGFNRVIFDELEKSDPVKFHKALASLSNMTVGVADQPSHGAPTTSNSAAPQGAKPSLSSFWKK